MNRLMIFFILSIITCTLQSPTLQAAEKQKPVELYKLDSFKNADGLTVINAFEAQLDHYLKSAKTIDRAWLTNFTQWLTPDMISILKRSKDFPLVKEYVETNLADKLQLTLEVSIRVLDSAVSVPLLTRGPFRESIHELSPLLCTQLRAKNPATRSLSDSAIAILRQYEDTTKPKDTDQEYSFETPTTIKFIDVDNKECKEQSPQEETPVPAQQPKLRPNALRKTVSSFSLRELD